MMAEPGEELQESHHPLNSLRSRAGGVPAETIHTGGQYQELYHNLDPHNEDEDYEASLCQTLTSLLEDVTACDVQVALTIIILLYL